MHSPRADWTLAQAEAANAEYLETHPRGPAEPFFQWAALLDIERMRPAIVGGDGFDMLAAICKCAQRDLVMPEWLAREFIKRYMLVVTCRSDSWDEAFGRPYPKGTQLSAIRTRREKRLSVYFAVKQSGLPICADTFRTVGQRFGISKSLAEQFYYQVKRAYEDSRGKFRLR